MAALFLHDAFDFQFFSEIDYFFLTTSFLKIIALKHEQSQSILSFGRLEDFEEDYEDAS